MFYSCRVRLDAESIGVRSASSYVLLHHTGFEGAVILRPQVDEARFSRLVPEVLFVGTPLRLRTPPLSAPTVK